MDLYTGSYRLLDPTVLNTTLSIKGVPYQQKFRLVESVRVNIPGGGQPQPNDALELQLMHR